MNELLALLIACVLAPAAEARRGQDVKPHTVSMEIVLAEDRQPLRFEPIAWERGMTVQELMTALADREDEFSFRHSGDRLTFFVLEINGVANEGGRGSNWLFYVNDELAQSGAGVVRLGPGDQVRWQFKRYQIKP